MKFDLTKMKFKIVKKFRPSYEEIGEVGDYYENTILVKNVKNRIYNQLILIHELIEYFLNSEKGILWQEVDLHERSKQTEFDKRFPEKAKIMDENHKVASQIEKILCQALGINYEEYNKYIENYEAKPINKRKINPSRN